MNKNEESRSIQKGGSFWRGYRLTQLSWRVVYRHRDSGRHRARHFVCRCRYQTEVFDDFRRHVSVSSNASYTLPRNRRHWRRRHFVRRISFDGWHILYCITLEKKRILSAMKEIERISSISSMFFFPSYFWEFARKETRLDDASGRLHFFV